jgi:hypothetical protein
VASGLDDTRSIEAAISGFRRNRPEMDRTAVEQELGIGSLVRG